MFRELALRSVNHLLVLVFATLLFSFSIAIGGRALQLYELRQQEALLKREIAVLESKRQGFEEQRTAASGDEEVERVAREQLGWVKPGEIGVVVLGPRPEAAAEPAPQPAVPPDTRRGWEQWRDWLLLR